MNGPSADASCDHGALVPIAREVLGVGTVLGGILSRCAVCPWGRQMKLTTPRKHTHVLTRDSYPYCKRSYRQLGGRSTFSRKRSLGPVQIVSEVRHETLDRRNPLPRNLQVSNQLIGCLFALCERI